MSAFIRSYRALLFCSSPFICLQPSTVTPRVPVKARCAQRIREVQREFEDIATAVLENSCNSGSEVA
eukprot:4240277-Amphidinium_carterae.1